MIIILLFILVLILISCLLFLYNNSKKEKFQETDINNFKKDSQAQNRIITDDYFCITSYLNKYFTINDSIVLKDNDDIDDNDIPSICIFTAKFHTIVAGENIGENGYILRNINGLYLKGETFIIDHINSAIPRNARQYTIDGTGDTFYNVLSVSNDFDPEDPNFLFKIERVPTENKFYISRRYNNINYYLRPSNNNVISYQTFENRTQIVNEKWNLHKIIIKNDNPYYSNQNNNKLSLLCENYNVTDNSCKPVILIPSNNPIDISSYKNSMRLSLLGSYNNDSNIINYLKHFVITVENIKYYLDTSASGNNKFLLITNNNIITAKNENSSVNESNSLYSLDGGNFFHLDYCFNPRIDYYGNDIDTISNVVSAIACQRECINNNNCNYFTYASPGSERNYANKCWLKDSNENIRADNYRTSGPKVCPILPTIINRAVNSEGTGNFHTKLPSAANNISIGIREDIKDRYLIFYNEDDYQGNFFTINSLGNDSALNEKMINNDTGIVYYDTTDLNNIKSRMFYWKNIANNINSIYVPNKYTTVITLINDNEEKIILNSLENNTMDIRSISVEIPALKFKNHLIFRNQASDSNKYFIIPFQPGYFSNNILSTYKTQNNSSDVNIINILEYTGELNHEVSKNTDLEIKINNAVVNISHNINPPISIPSITIKISNAILNKYNGHNNIYVIIFSNNNNSLGNNREENISKIKKYTNYYKIIQIKKGDEFLIRNYGSTGETINLNNFNPSINLLSHHSNADISVQQTKENVYNSTINNDNFRDICNTTECFNNAVMYTSGFNNSGYVIKWGNVQSNIDKEYNDNNINNNNVYRIGNNITIDYDRENYVFCFKINSNNNQFDKYTINSRPANYKLDNNNDIWTRILIPIGIRVVIYKNNNFNNTSNIDNIVIGTGQIISRQFKSFRILEGVDESELICPSECASANINIDYETNYISPSVNTRQLPDNILAPNICGSYITDSNCNNQETDASTDCRTCKYKRDFKKTNMNVFCPDKCFKTKQEPQEMNNFNSYKELVMYKGKNYGLCTGYYDEDTGTCLKTDDIYKNLYNCTTCKLDANDPRYIDAKEGFVSTNVIKDAITFNKSSNNIENFEDKLNEYKQI